MPNKEQDLGETQKEERGFFFSHQMKFYEATYAY